MDFKISSEGIDVAKLMSEIRKSIEEKKKAGHLTDDDIRELADEKIEKLSKEPELDSDILEMLHKSKDEWNIIDKFEISSHRRKFGNVMVWIKRDLLKERLLKWLISVLRENFKKQRWLNFYYAHLIHNLVYELTKLQLESDKLKNRLLHLEQEHTLLKHREKALEELTLEEKNSDKAES